MDDLLMTVYDWREAKRLAQRSEHRVLREWAQALSRSRPVITLSPAYRIVPAKDVLLAVLIAALHVRRRHAQ